MSSLLRQVRQSSRTIAVASLTALLTVGSPMAGFAQYGIVARGQTQTVPPTQQQPVPTTTQEQTTPGQNPITKPITQSPDVPPDRVGVRTGDVQSLTMQDAITLALQNNLDIEQFRQGVRIADRNLYSLKGIYDILSTSDVNYRSTTQPVVSIFGGGGTTSSLTQKSLNYNFTTSQFMQQTGGYWEVDFNNSRTVTSSTASLLTTQYNPTLTLQFTQPLMRNFGIDQNRHLIQIAQKTLDLSDSQFRQRVIEIINSVQRGYWDLVFAIRNEKIARESVELAKQQLDNNSKMVDAGTLAPIELRSTEAQLETAKGNVILALQGITTAENALKVLLLKDPADKIWYSAIAPTDEPQFNKPSFDLDEATRLALKNRPELEQMRLQTEQKNIDIKYYTNQTKPQIDFVGNYGSTGLAGTPSTIVSGSSGFDPTTQGLLDNLNLALNKLNLNTFNPTPPTARALGANVLDRFNGGYFQALHNLFTNDFKSYQVGVHFSFPWRNRTAEGNLGRTLAESRQLDARQRQLVESVGVDVRNALQAVVASRQRFEAAQAAELASLAQYNGEQERYRAGLSTNFVVLQRQTDLSVAKGNTVRALTDYNKALADMQRVTGMTLVSNNVQISSQDTTK
ncbi:MAG TPA: TolC family protein [Blastocatellia bacterium]|nr:TolC family protein [Blastocatellia bacterium]